MTREAGAAFIVNDHIDLAILMVGADGVHIGPGGFSGAGPCAGLVGPRRWPSGCPPTRPVQALSRRGERGADYIGVGPIFRTFTKEDVVDPVGFEVSGIRRREPGRSVRGYRRNQGTQRRPKWSGAARAAWQWSPR